MTKSTIGNYVIENLSQASSDAFVAPDIPLKKLSNSAQFIAGGICQKSILGIFDATLFGSAKHGVVFVDELLYFRPLIGTIEKHKYHDLLSIHRKGNTLVITQANNHSFEMYLTPEQADGMLPFLEGLIELANNPNDSQNKSDEQNTPKTPTNCIGCGAGYAQAVNTGARCEWCDTPY